jgi:hypothetical protein
MKNKVANSLMHDTDLNVIEAVLNEAIEWNKVHRRIAVEDLIRRLCKKYFFLSTGCSTNRLK